MSTPPTRVENFLGTPPCPFRRVSFGNSLCTISTDNHVNEVDPLTCHNCDVPGIIAKPRCTYLSLGTELKPYRGEGKLVCAMACRALNIKLYSLKTCDECPLYSEASSLAESIRANTATASISIPVSEALVEQVARDIRLDYGVREDEAPPLQPIRCWRFPEGRCRKFPVYAQRKVTVLLKRSERNDELWKAVIEPTLKGLNYLPYRVDEELLGDEEMCRGCENCQEGDVVLLSLDDWNANAVFLSGLAYGIGKRVLLLKNRSLAPVPLAENMEHDVVRFDSTEELRQALLASFGSGQPLREA